MARDLSPMYCSREAIAGLEEEKARAEHLLRNHLKGAPGIVLLALEDPDWVYGQATFPLKEGRPLKFVDRFSTIVSNRVLETLAAQGSASAILFIDAALKVKFERHQAFARVKPLFRQVTGFMAEPDSGSWFSRIKKFFSNPVDPTPKKDEAQACRDGVKIHADYLLREESLSELLLGVVALHHYCALDKAQETLESRVRARPADVVAQTALTLLLSDFGDHETALVQARIATNLPDAPPEAYLWQAKEAWWADKVDEGLQALARIQVPPKHWPNVSRRGVETVRAALLSQQGEHAAAAKALEHAIEIDGSDIALHLCLADELQLAGQIEEARAAVYNARVLNPNSLIVQVEVCRVLEAQGQGAALQKALGKLCKTDRGRLEARRFTASEAIEGVEPALPKRFGAIDQARRHALRASMLPTWFQLCEDSPVTTLFNLFLQDAHLGEDEWIPRGLSYTIRRLASDPLDPAAHASAAGICYGREQFKTGNDWCRSAVALAPDVESYHYAFITGLRAAGRLNEAFDAASLALDLGKADDKLKAIYRDLFWSNIPLRLDEAMLLLSIPSSRQKLVEAAKGRLGTPAWHSVANLVLVLANRMDDDAEAMELQKTLLHIDPNCDDLQRAHIALLQALGHDEESLADSEKRAAVLDSRRVNLDAEAFARMAEAKVDSEEFESADLCVRAGLQLAPRLYELQVAKARVLLGFGRQDEAFSGLREVAFSNTTLAGRAARLLGDGLSGAGRREEALTIWKHLQLLEPESAAGFLGAGVDYWVLDRDAEAADMVALAVQLDGSDPYAWGLYGRILHALGRFDDALKALERAMAFERPAKYALRDLTTTLISMDRADDALARCDAAMEVDPANTEAATGRVEALSATGKRDEALSFGLSWLSSSAAEVSDFIAMRQAIERRCGLEAALSAGEVALVRHPDAVDLLVDQAWDMSAVGRFPNALSLARKAMQLQSEAVAPLQAYAHASVYCGELQTDEAVAIAKQLTSGQESPYALRLAADVLRAGNVDTRPAYEAALRAGNLEAPPDDHGMAWCLLHLGLLKEALVRMDSHVASNPEVGAATIDRAIIGYLAFDGGLGWEQMLADAIRTTSHLERGPGYLAEVRALLPQWRKHSLATMDTLDNMSTVIEQTASKVSLSC